MAAFIWLKPLVINSIDFHQFFEVTIIKFFTMLCKFFGYLSLRISCNARVPFSPDFVYSNFSHTNLDNQSTATIINLKFSLFLAYISIYAKSYWHNSSKSLTIVLNRRSMEVRNELYLFSWMLHIDWIILFFKFVQLSCVLSSCHTKIPHSKPLFVFNGCWSPKIIHIINVKYLQCLINKFCCCYWPYFQFTFGYLIKLLFQSFLCYQFGWVLLIIIFNMIKLLFNLFT